MSEVQNITLYQGVLNDDFARVLDEKHYYKGHNRARVALFYYTFANEWSDKEGVKFFRTLENAIEWYKKTYRDRAIYQGRVWLSEDTEEERKRDDDGIIITDDDEALNEFDCLTLYCEQ